MNCFEKFNCGGICCYDGVYLKEQDEKNIRECIEKYPEQFQQENYFEIGKWCGYNGGLKTKTVPYEHDAISIPEHFNHTKCVFQQYDGKCQLQVVAEQNGEEKWQYKPETCRTFPVILVDGKPLFRIDESASEDYPGFESYLPCVKSGLDESFFTNEIEYLLSKSKK